MGRHHWFILQMTTWGACSHFLVRELCQKDPMPLCLQTGALLRVRWANSSLDLGSEEKSLNSEVSKSHGCCWLSSKPWGKTGKYWSHTLFIFLLFIHFSVGDFITWWDYLINDSDTLLLEKIVLIEIHRLLLLLLVLGLRLINEIY